MKGFDQECLGLAEYFLEGEDFYTNASREQKRNISRTLAQSIQDAIEDWFTAVESEIKKEAEA